MMPDFEKYLDCYIEDRKSGKMYFCYATLNDYNNNLYFHLINNDGKSVFISYNRIKEFDIMDDKTKFASCFNPYNPLYDKQFLNDAQSFCAISHYIKNGGKSC